MAATTPRSKALQILRWLLAPVLLLIGKRRMRQAKSFPHHRLEDGLEEDGMRAAALKRQLAEAQQADAMEGGGLGRGNDLAAKMYNEFVDEQSDNLVQLFGDFLLGVFKACLPPTARRWPCDRAKGVQPRLRRLLLDSDRPSRTTPRFARHRTLTRPPRRTARWSATSRRCGPTCATGSSGTSPDRSSCSTTRRSSFAVCACATGRPTRRGSGPPVIMFSFYLSV